MCLQLQLWTVVYLHGLESGPNGSKARYIQRHFPGSLVPDLQMSAWDFSKKNSAVRKFANLQASLDGCTAEAMSSIRAAEAAERAAGRGNRKMMIVGSSWGGMVAIDCLRKGLKPEAMVLLAPALAAKGFYGMFWPKVEVADALLDNMSPHSVLVLHGTDDDTCPIDASRDFAAKFCTSVKLLELQGGDHRLNAALGITAPGEFGASASAEGGVGVSGEGKSLKDYVLQMMMSCTADLSDSTS
jgi:predicted esterase